VISLRDVGVTYRARGGMLEALRGIDLDIRVEFLCVVGPSGCGKSTLLRLLAGLIPPTRGTIEADFDPTRSYGIVFQDYSLLPWLTVRQNIELALTLRSVAPSVRGEVSARLLHQLGLEGTGDLLPHQLSGGMRQRVAVGRVFAQAPSLLLMDEPFGALDRLTRSELQEVLTQMYESEPHTVVFVTHDVEEAVFLSDRTCVLSERPAHVNRIIDVPFARPRSQKIKRDPGFQELRYQIEDSLSQARQR
jgi:NitT/TauT family transport system ATP-binding protein